MPGGLRVGREPFDAETREALERGNPILAFDWPSLTKSLTQSLSAARWAARQERPGAGRRPPRGRGAARAAGMRGLVRAAGRGRDRRAAVIVAEATVDAATGAAATAHAGANRRTE